MIGLSHGVKPPFVSLGIEKTEKNPEFSNKIGIKNTSE